MQEDTSKKEVLEPSWADSKITQEDKIKAMTLDEYYEYWKNKRKDHTPTK